MLPAVRRQPDLVNSTVLNLYKSYMGANASRLPAVRFYEGTLFLTAINVGWKKEGKGQEASIIKLINHAFKEDLVKNIRWVPWPDEFKKGKREEVEEKAPVKTLSPQYEEHLASIKNEDVRKAFREFLCKLPKLNQ